MKSKIMFAVAAVALSGVVQAAGVKSVLPDNLNWQDAHGVPPGAKVAILSGNPKKNEFFVARIKLPADYMIPPHSHLIPEYDTVISGTFYLGTGEKVDKSKGMELPAGSYVTIPMKQVHYSWTKEETILQITGMGPWGTYYTDKKLDKQYA